jgi:hypothetical protein
LPRINAAARCRAAANHQLSTWISYVDTENVVLDPVNSYVAVHLEVGGHIALPDLFVATAFAWNTGGAPSVTSPIETPFATP